VDSETRTSIRLPNLYRKEVIYKPHTVQFVTGDLNIKQGDKRRSFVTKWQVYGLCIKVSV